MSIRSKNSNIVNVIIAGLVLGAVFVALVTVAPKLSLWSKTYSVDAVYYDEVEPGGSVSAEFDAPFERLTEISVDFKYVGVGDPVERFDGRLVLEQSDGEIICSEEIHSVLEENHSINGVSLNPDEPYRLSFVLDSVSGGMESVGICVDSDGHLSYSISGMGSGAPSKSAFITVYVICSALVLLYVFYCKENDPVKTVKADRIIFIAALLMSTFLFFQFYDMFMGAKNGLRMIEAIKEGRFFDYYDYAYETELKHGSESLLFSYHYNVFILFPIALFMIPLSLFVDADVTNGALGSLVMVYLNIIIAILVACSVRMISRISDSCKMPSSYNSVVKYFYAFSPYLFYCTVLFGQFDIMYVLVMMLAIPYYFNRRYKTFSLVMAVAISMKLFPLLVFFPLILLANKKVKDITVNTLIALSMKAVTSVLFEQSAGYKSIMVLIDGWYSFMGQLFRISLDEYHSLFILSFVMICILCYMKDLRIDNTSESLYYVMLVIFITYGAFILFVYEWHVQWLIPFVLSSAFLMAFFGRDRRLILLMAVLDLLLMIDGAVDMTALAGMGLFTYGNGYGYSGVSLQDILMNITPYADSIIKSAEAAIVIFFMAFFIYKRRSVTNESSSEDKEYVFDRPFAAGRILVLFALIVFSYWCYSFV